MSLVIFIASRPNLFDLAGLPTVKRLAVRQAILTNRELEKIRALGSMKDNQYRTPTLDITFPVEEGVSGMAAALDALCESAEAAVRDGDNILSLSDRLVSAQRLD